MNIYYNWLQISKKEFPNTKITDDDFVYGEKEREFAIILSMVTGSKYCRAERSDSNTEILGHAVAIVGYTISENKGLCLKYKNSWGKEFGYHGYGHMTQSVWEKYFSHSVYNEFKVYCHHNFDGK